MTYYDLDGSVCGQERALELFKDLGARTVDSTRLSIAGHDVLVSTVYLIADHSTAGKPPLLWATEVIGGPPDIDGTVEMYSSREVAQAGHDNMVERMIASGCHPVLI